MKCNISPASRVEAIKEYYFSKKLREVAQMNSRGMDVISLGIGGPDRMPPAEAIEELCRSARQAGNHSYQPYQGIPLLRKAFSQWYKRIYDVTIDPDRELLPLIGSKEGVLHVSLTFLNAGDGVLVPNPGYPTYSGVSHLVGARVIPYELTAENDWQPDFEALEAMDLSGVKLMWVNYPHMPSGARAGIETFERLVDFGRRHSIVIVHDNPYSLILNNQPLSIFNVEGAKDIAIELNSLSKSHNMAGWRVAMATANEEFISWITKVKSNIDSGQFRPVMEAAAKALESGDEWYCELNRVYHARREVAFRIMDLLGCTYDLRQVGLFAWGRIPDKWESAEQLADRLLYDARVFVTPGSVFGSAGNRYIRVSLCATEANLERALMRIKEIEL